jgi:predicted metal-dependent hydrolase
MGRMSADISAIIDRFQGRKLDAHYLAFFECFNRGLFFEAHEVLEKIWLPQRKATNGPFYKGLIQLAGAFVHLQKNRLRPAGSLLELARANLERYSPTHDGLDVKSVLEMIKGRLDQLNEGKFLDNPLKSRLPRIKLICSK